MSDLPKTSTTDLIVMGITPEMIKDKLNELGFNIKGDIKGYFLPDEGYNKDFKIKRARNYAKSDWKAIEKRPPQIINDNKYTQDFNNFESDKPFDFQYNHSTTIHQGVDYNETKSWNVTVNASLPIGISGALIGFNAGMTSTEVHSKSWSKTEGRDINFPLTVPAMEGRRVTESTVETSVDVVYEAQVGVQNTVGIEVDPAWYKPNVRYWLYNVEQVFYNHFATSRIVRSAIDTTVSTTISKLSPPAETAREAIEGSILSYTNHAHKPIETSEELPDLLPEVGIEIVPKASINKPHQAPLVAREARMIFTFEPVRGNPIPVAMRAPAVEQFRRNLLGDPTLQPGLRAPGVTQPVFSPHRNAPASATLQILYQDNVITQQQVNAAILRAGSAVNWGGTYGFQVQWT